MIIKKPESQLKVLESLARFKFLTSVQLLDLGVRGNLTNTRNELRKLRDLDKLIDRAEFGTVPPYGRLPDVYYLTKSGVRFLVDHLDYDEGGIKYPDRPTSMFQRDYFHRVATVDFFIAFRQWCDSKGYSVDVCDTYFDKIGANAGNSPLQKLEARTKIFFEDGDYLIPDGAVIFEARDREHFFLFEYYAGADTKRVIGQLEKHALAISEGAPSTKYGTDRGNFVVCAFESENAMNAVMKRMQENTVFTAFKKHFRFKSIDGVKTSFYDGWSLFSGDTVNFI